MPSGFFLILFCMIFFVFLCCFYVASRIFSLFPLKKSRVWAAMAGILMLLFFVLGFGKSMIPMPDSLRDVLGASCACWLGVFLYLILCFLASDFAVLLLRLIPKSSAKKARRCGSAVALALALAVSGYGFYHAGDVQTKEYTISLAEGAKGELVIALVSDLHLGATGAEARLPDIVSAINAMEPDAVLIAGDLFDSGLAAAADPDRAAELFRQIKAPLGVYACLGNHDYGSSVAEAREYLAGCGITLLLDEQVTVDGRFVLAGRLDSSPIGGDEWYRAEPEKVLAGIPEGLPVIVMDHNPTNIREYDGLADLVVSGHTHRGQVWPGGLITGALYAVDYGYYRAGEGSPHVVVTSGAGTWGPPMRVGTDSEVVKLILELP